MICDWGFYVDRRIEEHWLHLFRQLAVDILYLDPTLEEALFRLAGRSIPLVFVTRHVKRSVNRLSLRIGLQESLGTLDFSRVQEEVLACNLPSRGGLFNFHPISIVTA